MAPLFLLGDWLLIFSLAVLITARYRTYILIPQSERPKRTTVGLAVTALLTLVLVGIAVLNIIRPYPNQLFSLFIYLIALMIWATSSWWGIPTRQTHQNRFLLLGNVLAATGFLLILGLFIAYLLQKFK